MNRFMSFGHQSRVLRLFAAGIGMVFSLSLAIRPTFSKGGLIFLVACFAGFSAWSALALTQPLAIVDAVAMSRSGTPPEDVIRRIRDSKTTYALRGSDFGKLKAAGVPDQVLDYLQQSFVNDVDLLTRYWAQGADLGGCSSCYPQPVEVDKLESGYSAAPTPPPGGYQLSRPMGTPAWVPYPQRLPTAAPISVSDVRQMTRDGVPQTQIIDRINHSPLTHVIGVGGSLAVRSQPVAGLSGSELARLHDEGVADPALDALQGQFLSQFIEFERLRYQSWGKKK
jgi:hypothetical protein